MSQDKAMLDSKASRVGRRGRKFSGTAARKEQKATQGNFDQKQVRDLPIIISVLSILHWCHIERIDPYRPKHPTERHACARRGMIFWPVPHKFP